MDETEDLRHLGVAVFYVVRQVNGCPGFEGRMPEIPPISDCLRCVMASVHMTSILSFVQYLPSSWTFFRSFKRRLHHGWNLLNNGDPCLGVDNKAAVIPFRNCVKRERQYFAFFACFPSTLFGPGSPFTRCSIPAFMATFTMLLFTVLHIVAAAITSVVILAGLLVVVLCIRAYYTTSRYVGFLCKR